MIESVRTLLEQADRSSQIIASHVAVIALKDGVIKTANIKIAALTLELAHHRRMRFANKSEAFSAEQRDLFEETWNTDLAAMEAEVAQQSDVLSPEQPKPKRPRAGRQPLPADLPRIERRHEPELLKSNISGSIYNDRQQPWTTAPSLCLQLFATLLTSHRKFQARRNLTDLESKSYNE